MKSFWALPLFFLLLVIAGGLCAGLAEVSETDWPSGADRTDSMPRLTSRSEDYWTVVSNSIGRHAMKRFFPNGIPMEADFGTWLGFATNSRAREKAVRAIIRVDRAGSIPFLEWMSRTHLDWNEERSLAFAQIALAPPWWATNRPPRWSPEEQSAFAGFFKARFLSETNWRCRLHMDDFFCRTEPDWKSSDERLAFLERSLRLSGTEATSNPILRRIESRFEPDDMETYYRRRVQW